MKKENLEIGNKLHSRIKEIKSLIEKLEGTQYKIEDEEKEGTPSYIDIKVYGNMSPIRLRESEIYTEKANTNLKYLNQFYRDNTLRTLQDCKEDLEKEFEAL